MMGDRDDPAVTIRQDEPNGGICELFAHEMLRESKEVMVNL
jgi:hypothetical protein